MAKITRMPSTAIIDGFKGTLDYYVHDGQACVRSWPRSPGKKRSVAVEEQWPAFTIASRLWNELSPEIQASFNSMAQASGLNGRDLSMRAYLIGLYTNPH